MAIALGLGVAQPALAVLIWQSQTVDNTGGAGATLTANLYSTVQQVRSNLAVLLPSGDSQRDEALQKAIAKVDQGLSPELWQLPTSSQLSSQG